MLGSGVIDVQVYGRVLLAWARSLAQYFKRANAVSAMFCRLEKAGDSSPDPSEKLRSEHCCYRDDQ